MTQNLCEIYKYSNMNSNQIQKHFSISPNKVFSETNSKKHLNKILDMIKQNFYNSKTTNYSAAFLFPIKSKDEYEKRKEALTKISSINFNKEITIQTKEIISNIKKIDTKIIFTKTIYALDIQAQKILYDSYKINSFHITKKELEEIVQTERDFIVISEENIYIEADTYTLSDFIKIIKGAIIKKNKSQIIELLNLLELTKDYKQNIIETTKILSKEKLHLIEEPNHLKEILEKDKSKTLKELTTKALALEEETSNINKELKNIISTQKLSIEGDELLELLNTGNTIAIAEKFKEKTKDVITNKEKELLDIFREQKISITHIFENKTYPLILDEEIKEEIIKQIEQRSSQIEFEEFEELGEFEYKKIQNLFSYAYLFDFLFAISKFIQKYELTYPKISQDELIMIQGRNIYIKDARPIDYALGVKELNNIKLNNEKISILTGANSGGKTTLLEMFLQAQILTHIGLPIPADKSSKIKLFDEIIYLKKFTGTQGSGAFEQTVRNLIEIIDSNSEKLILIDEFEAITEPGAAAKILIEFLLQIADQNNFCIGVSHLGIEIKKFIEERKIQTIRIDGISAMGIDKKGNLITDHQPQFNKLGKSTPELILKKILSDEKFFKNKSPKSKEILEKII